MLLFILGLVIGSICGVFVMCLCRVSADSDKYFYNTQSEYKVYQPNEELTTQPPNRDSLVKTNKINIRESYEKGGGVNTNPPSERPPHPNPAKPNLEIFSMDEIHKYMKQFNVTYEVAIYEMHQLIDKYKEYQQTVKGKQYV